METDLVKFNWLTNPLRNKSPQSFIICFVYIFVIFFNLKSILSHSPSAHSIFSTSDFGPHSLIFSLYETETVLLGPFAPYIFVLMGFAFFIKQIKRLKNLPLFMTSILIWLIHIHAINIAFYYASDNALITPGLIPFLFFHPLSMALKTSTIGWGITIFALTVNCLFFINKIFPLTQLIGTVKFKLKRRGTSPLIPKTPTLPNPIPTKKPLQISTQPFELPSSDLLIAPPKRIERHSQSKLRETAEKLKQVLLEYGVTGEMGKIFPGPIVTLYEFEPAPGIKASRVIGLASDISRSMSAISTRISVMPGRNAMSIEIPNQTRHTVYLKNLIHSKPFFEHNGKLTLTLGQNIKGEPVFVDLAKMPHLLIAGTTGSGKSVSVNAMILSLLFKLKPSQCRLIMIDPKMLELSVYDGIPHLITSVVTDPQKAVQTLKWAVSEMEKRYSVMSKIGVRNLEGYNERIKNAQDTGEILSFRAQSGFDQESGKPIYDIQTIPYDILPHIVIIVDEMADLMMVAGKEIEVCVQRLAQMARAAGIHLIMATQRPSVDVITGTIKANFPTRISFHVTSKIDSRTILGEQGAEQLLGQGDMLYMKSGGKIERVHGPFVTDREVERIVNHLKKQNIPQDNLFIDFAAIDTESNMHSIASIQKNENDHLQKAIEIMHSQNRISTSLVQRHLRIGYNKAARIIEEMEEKGLITPPDHSGKRQIVK